MIYPSYLKLPTFYSSDFFVGSENNFENRVEWSVGHLNPAGKRVSVAQPNECVLTTTHIV